MANVKGLSDLQIARIHQDLLTDSAVVYQLASADARGIETWTAVDLPSTPCRLLERSVFTFGATQISQLYDGLLVLAASTVLQSKTQYKFVVTMFDPSEDEQATLRTRTLLGDDFEQVRDHAGRDIFTVVQVKSAKA